ncbi:hypothetical protein B0H13DRAFT_950447 [Mycena leptocephala]|nr:hypothetical protein B0H13DRAFT_950447 [Mycena leptocephala]
MRSRHRRRCRRIRVCVSYTPPSFLRWCAGALVPCLHHPRIASHARTYPPPPTSYLMHLASPCASGSEVGWGTRWLYTARSSRASTVEVRGGAALDGVRATGGVRAFPAQLAGRVGVGSSPQWRRHFRGCKTGGRLSSATRRRRFLGVRHLVLPGAARTFCVRHWMVETSHASTKLCFVSA